MNKSAPPTAALPIAECPFCGLAPMREAHSGKDWVWHKPTGCLMDGFDATLERWNTRAPAVQATADADGCAREILSTHHQVWQESIHSGHTVGEADAAQVAHVAAIIRKAVSPKAAAPQWMKEADCLLGRVAYELSQASMSAKVSDYMRGQMKRWSQDLNEFRLVHLQPASPAAVSGDRQEKERG